MSSNSGGSSSTAGIAGLLGALGLIVGALFALVAAIFSVLALVFRALPFIIVSLSLLLAAMIIIPLQSQGVETVVETLVTVVYPTWHNDIRPIVVALVEVLDPVLCWTNAATSYLTNVIRNVIYPTIQECGVKTIFSDFATFLKYVGLDLVVFFANGSFLTSYADFSRVTPAGIALAQDWINLYMCACSELGNIVRVLPILSPTLLVPPLIPLVIFSQEWTDPQTWCAIANAFNAVVALCQQAIKLTLQVLALLFGQVPAGTPFIRPDISVPMDLACSALHCVGRSTENAYQLFWDTYVPFKFVWHEFLCVFDTLGCIALKTFAWLFSILVNIDQAVTYPQNDWWPRVSKPQVIALINMWAAPSPFSPIAVPPSPAPTRYFMTTYNLNTSDPLSPDGITVNPLFGQMRVTDCLCIFIDRLICDPADNQTACFSSGAQNLLMGLDFCCLTNTAGTTLADVAAALFESSLHFARGSDDFFLSLDAQPFTTQLAVDITNIAHCLLSVFGLIPTVGTSIQNLLTDVVQFISRQIDFAFRGIVGLASLPYFLIVLPDISNFITAPNRALDLFLSAFQGLIADTNTSFKNCLCAILNNGFPIPPIPCSSCEVGGFLPPPPVGHGKRRYTSFIDAGGPVGLLRTVWPNAQIANHITPLIRYDNHTSDVIQLFNMLWVNSKTLDPNILGMPDLRSVDAFVDRKKAELLERWGQSKQCNAKADELRRMARTEPRLFNYHKERGDFDGQCMHNPEQNMAAFAPFPKTLPTLPNYQDDRNPIIIEPTQPPVVGCNNPVPQCFDLCCIFRATLVLGVQVISTLARGINDLMQGGNPAALGVLQAYPYFTGEYANYGLPTFESDFIAIILDAFVPITCGCDVLNLVIPVIPSAFTTGRPDICCAIGYISQLIAGTVQVIFNMINSLTMGSSNNFAYFTQGLFIADVNTLFDIALLAINCICVFVRAIFPPDYIPGFANATDFDICCGVQVILDTVTELLRLILQIVISLATISVTPSSFCYWRLDQTTDHQCAGTLDGIGVIVQIDKVLDTFFPVHTTNFPGQFVTLPDGTQTWVSDTNPTDSGGPCYATCGIDDGASGIVPCICQIFNTLIPFRRFPNLKVNCSPDPTQTNCQELDLCCGFAKLGFAISDFTKFMMRALVSLWQSWTGGLPEFFVHYIWCEEPYLVPCPQYQAQQTVNSCGAQVNKQIPQCPGTHPVLAPDNSIEYRCGEFTCGAFNIVIADLTDPFQGLLSRCVCEIVALLDTLIAFIFDLLRPLGGPFEYATWSCCFCGGSDPVTGTCNSHAVNPCGGGVFSPFGSPVNPTGSGIIPAVSYIANALLVASVRLTRGFPLSCYWHPAPGGKVPSQISETWIFEFLGPTADAAAIATGNTICILQSMFFLPLPAMPLGEKFLGSTVRWGFEVVFRIIGFIEAFVESLITPELACTGPNCASTGPDITEAHGVSADKLGSMLVILFSIPFDLLIGDSAVACTTICPPFDAMPAPDAHVIPSHGCVNNPYGVNHSCSCGCWNDSPMFGGSLQTTSHPPYVWVQSSLVGPGAPCLDTSPNAVKNNLTRHVGEIFGRTDGCCQLITPPPNPSWLSAFPVCQSPADSDLLYDTHKSLTTGAITYTPTGYPGSCVYFSACRPDNLPSIANDPMTPIGLSANYGGAIDGLVLGFFRYMRALLDHLFTCQTAQAHCNPGQQYGIIFYPAILIFSIVWQLLGGLINFFAALTVFFFTLFQPPTGSYCGCWASGVTDHFGETRTQFYRQTAALCYACRVIGMDCNTPVDYGNHINDPSWALSYRCRPYCPVMQLLANPTLTQSEAHAACLANWTTYTPKDWTSPGWTGEEVCSGHINNTAAGRTGFGYYQYYPNYGFQQCFLPLPAECNTGGDPFNCQTGVSPGHGLCNPIDFNNNSVIVNATTADKSVNGPGQLCGNDVSHYISLDLCPDPSCIYLNGTICEAGQCGVVGFWPCGQGGGSVFDTVYPNNPLIGCGLLQILTGLTQVFADFTAMFTTPIFISPNTAKRGMGPVRREPRQVFDKRMRNAWSLNQQRFQGVAYGQTTGSPNLAWVITSAVYDYDTSDCYTDPLMCHCRNLDIGGYCSVTTSGELMFGPLGLRKRNRDDPDDTSYNMTVSELTQMLSTEIFTGSSVCDQVVAGVAGLDWDDNVTMEQKHHVIACSDRLFMGSRLNTLQPAIPADIMYNSQAPLTLMTNLFGTAKRMVQERHAPRPHGPQDEPAVEDDVRTDFQRRFPNWQAQLAERKRFARKTLEEKYGWKASRMMYSAIVHADSLWFKYESGYYSWMANQASTVLTNGTRRILPSTSSALTHVQNTAYEFARIIWNQPYRKVVDATIESTHLTARMLSNVYNEGTFNVAARTLKEYRAYRVERISRSDAPRRVSRLAEAVKWSPLFRWLWWNNETAAPGELPPRPSIFAPFIEHMQRVVSVQRARWHEQPRFTLWTADLHFWSFSDILLRRWRNPQWTPEKLANWEKLGAFYWHTRHLIWPDEELPSHVERANIFANNCPVVDRLVNLTLNTVEYCAAQSLINMRMENPSTHNPNSYFGYRQMPSRYRLEAAARSGYIRPRLVAANESALKWRPHAADHRVYRVANGGNVPMECHGPACWNFLDWLFVTIENIFGVNLQGTRNTWLDAVIGWIKNPNLNDDDRPNVGLIYWLRFEFICNFPTSYNCSYGLGFELALWYSLAGFIVAFLVGAYIFPPITMPVQFFGWGFSMLAIFFALGFGFPLTCMLPVPFISTGFGIPECLPDQVLAFADKYITTCYSPLIIPEYMISGPLCPANGQIDFLDCRDVGVSDGIQNLLFLGVWLLGSPFVNAILQVTSTVIGVWIPGLQNYMELTLAAMQNANLTQFQRMEFCFFATIYTIIPVLFVLTAGIVVLASLATPLVLLAEGIVALFFASPLVALVPGMDASSWFPWRTRGQQQAAQALPTQPTLVQRYLYGMEELERKKRK